MNGPRSYANDEQINDIQTCNHSELENGNRFFDDGHDMYQSLVINIYSFAIECRFDYLFVIFFFHFVSFPFFFFEIRYASEFDRTNEKLFGHTAGKPTHDK